MAYNYEWLGNVLEQIDEKVTSVNVPEKRKKRKRRHCEYLKKEVDEGYFGTPVKRRMKMNDLQQRLGLPPRWEYCPTFGKVIAGKFLPMKCPMGSYQNNLLPETVRFHAREIFERELEGVADGAKVGMLVSLMRVNRYYTREERHPNDVVGVHCSHGFNRTGFVIVSYLVEICKFPVDVAVNLFADARPTGIYKQNYLDDLQARYGDEHTTLRSLGKPDWDSERLDPSLAEKLLNPKREITPPPEEMDGIPGQPRFMCGKVPGVELVDNDEERDAVITKIQQYCFHPEEEFPGTLALPLENDRGRGNIEMLEKDSHMVSWKADGIRYLVLIDGEEHVYAMDKETNIFRIPRLKFIHSQTKQHICNTLVDTTMVIDKVPKPNDQPGFDLIPRMLIYDMIVFEEKLIGEQDFRVRFDAIVKELIIPRQEARATGIIQPQFEPMGVRRKDFYNLEATQKLLEPKFRASMGHRPDGLIFQPLNFPYIAGKVARLLKWKPLDRWTIDFRLSIEEVVKDGVSQELIGKLYLSDFEPHFGIMPVTRELVQYDNRIIECRFNKTSTFWELVRARPDRSTADTFRRAGDMARAISYPVTQDELLAHIEQHTKNGRIM
ncbi:mRNA capping enzyme, catalytic domain-containing protein [Ditylenchus destructor]|uniref:mRNA-capping enzyme n=1 Tax=Ditylenchus destructor TaxID=166010 RepID=A0AAD4R5D5_9BILA|nr:mRNA capping enzyme, catalytic domain-containing protein [Ditylenchus destructor]